MVQGSHSSWCKYRLHSFVQEGRRDHLSLQIDEFQTSHGWLHHFKTIHNLVYKSICGEAKKADEVIVNGWLEMPPSLIAGYDPHDVLNADKAGLFFNLQCEKSLFLKHEPYNGGKKARSELLFSFATTPMELKT